MVNNDILKVFGLNVKYERLKLNLTQAQLAEILEVHEKHVCKIETGRQNVTLKTISKIANALNTNESNLLRRF